MDGWVSLEVSPLLAHDTVSTIAAARDLFARAGRPNLFIKIPGTKEGLPAIEEAIFAGVPVNVTLLFSPEQYVAAAEAYLRGIERRIAAGLNPQVGSVASMFISRWDAAVAGKVPEALDNRLGIAVAGRIYKAYVQLLSNPRPAATTAVGQHRHQGSQGLGYPLHQGAGLPIHGKHHAGENIECLRRSRRNWPDHARERRRLRRSFGAVRRSRCERGQLGSAPSGRGREIFCEFLE